MPAPEDVIRRITELRPGLQIDQEIGAPGGQKWVYQAHDREYGACCLKIIQSGEPYHQARLNRELLVLHETQDCPYLPTLLLTPDDPVGEEESAFPWYLEELLIGQTVSEMIGQPWNEIDALQLIKEVCIGINALWELGVVHRDIKPQNIFAAERGFVLLDPGMARHQTLETLTRIWCPPGPGTPGYCSPDQFQFKSDKLDARSDIFLLGIVAFEALTGVHPFWRQDTRNNYPNNMDNGPAAAIEQFGSQLSQDIKALLALMLSPRRHERPRTPSRLLALVKELIGPRKA